MLITKLSLQFDSARPAVMRVFFSNTILIVYLTFQVLYDIIMITSKKGENYDEYVYYVPSV